MKNLFLSAALMLAFAASAQQEVTATTTTATSSATQEQDKEYKKIEQSQIAPDVLKPAVAKYQDYSLVEAFVAEDGTEYKLVLTKDGKDVAAFFKSNGEFIKEVAA
jgi:hypothetical protein